MKKKSKEEEIAELELFIARINQPALKTKWLKSYAAKKRKFLRHTLRAAYLRKQVIPYYGTAFKFEMSAEAKEWLNKNFPDKPREFAWKQNKEEPK
jgi:hypothetical protein